MLCIWMWQAIRMTLSNVRRLSKEKRVWKFTDGNSPFWPSDPTQPLAQPTPWIRVSIPTHLTCLNPHHDGCWVNCDSLLGLYQICSTLVVAVVVTNIHTRGWTGEERLKWVCSVPCCWIPALQLTHTNVEVWLGWDKLLVSILIIELWYVGMWWWWWTYCPLQVTRCHWHHAWLHLLDFSPRCFQIRGWLVVVGMWWWWWAYRPLHVTLGRGAAERAPIVTPGPLAHPHHHHILTLETP